MKIQEKANMQTNGFSKNGYCLMHTTTATVPNSKLSYSGLPYLGNILYRKLTKSLYLMFSTIAFTYTGYLLLCGRSTDKIDFKDYYLHMDGAKYNASNSTYC